MQLCGDGATIGNRWEAYWFTPREPGSFVFARSAVYVVLATRLFGRIRTGSLHVLADTPPSLWDPVSFLAPIPIPQPAGTFLDLVAGVAVAAAILTVLGVAARWTGALASIAGLFLLLVANSFGKIDHDENVLAFMLLIVLVAPAVPLMRNRSNDTPSGMYQWPVRLLQASFALMLFSAAYTKLRTSGVDWVLSENMRNILVSENLYFRNPRGSEFALWVASEPWRWRAAAAGALIAEAGMVMVLVVRKAVFRLLAFALGASVVIGINYLIGLGGWPVMALLVVFLDVDRITATMRLDPRRGRRLMAASIAAITGLAIVVLFSRQVPVWLAAAGVAALIPVLVFEVVQSVPPRKNVDDDTAFGERAPLKSVDTGGLPSL